MSIGAFLVLCLVVFLLVGLPIAFSLGLTAVSYFFYTDNLRYLIVLAQRTFNGINSFELIAIPLFILAGDLMYEGKISQALVNLAKSLAGLMRGSSRRSPVCSSAPSPVPVLRRPPPSLQ